VQLAGHLRETGWEKSLQDAGCKDLTLTSQRTGQNKNTSWKTLIEVLQNLSPGEIAYGREISVRGELEVFSVRGQSAFHILVGV
jgi:hypothetical protein